jgi:alkylated DNA repair dioxygenase AlkB
MPSPSEPLAASAPFVQEVEDGGILLWLPHFLPSEEADSLFAVLKESISWKQERGRFGRLFPRLTALYGDDGVVYKYSGIAYAAMLWTEELGGVRRRVEEAAAAPFNSVLLNRYRDGQDSMGFHADDEPELGTNPIVPSISLGAGRRFLLRHNKSRKTLELYLTHGSLLIMAGTLQHHWQHALPKLPKTTADAGERINLTFRQLGVAPSAQS